MSNELKIINDENYQKWICEICQRNRPFFGGSCQPIKSGSSSKHRNDKNVLAYWKRNFG